MKALKCKYFFILICLIYIFGFECLGQQRQVYSQYMFNGLAINPAYAGNQKQLSSTFIYRKQWLKLKGAPNTQTLSLHNGAKKKRIGLGFWISRDEIGVHQNLNLYGCYAFKIKFKKSTLALGLQGGFDYLSSNYSLLNVDPVNDPLLPPQTAVLAPNVGTGIFYSTQKSYLGISVPFLINNKTFNKKDISVASLGTQERYYFITAGKVITVNAITKIKPSTLIRIQEKAPITVDINTNFIFFDAVSFGASYRTGRSMVFLAEFIITDNWRFGYSYDYTFSALRPFTSGSHELMLNYRINLNPEKCHTYF